MTPLSLSPAIHQCPVEMSLSKGWYFSPLMIPYLLWEFLAYIAYKSTTVTGFTPCNSWLFLSPHSSSHPSARLGSKDGWEQAPFRFTLRLAPLGSWLRNPYTRLSARPHAGHCPASARFYSFIPKVSILSEQMMFLLEQIFPDTYRGIKLMAFPPAPLIFVRGQRMTAEPSALCGGGGGCVFPTPPS